MVLQPADAREPLVGELKRFRGKHFDLVMVPSDGNLVQTACCAGCGERVVWVMNAEGRLGLIGPDGRDHEGRTCEFRGEGRS